VGFDWDERKDYANQLKHGVSFSAAQQAFRDPDRVIAWDIRHSQAEARLYCIGRVKEGILTVRFTHRHNVIRIFGAGFWRKGKRLDVEKNKIYR
jgi:uncharacterized protein